MSPLCTLQYYEQEINPYGDPVTIFWGTKSSSTKQYQSYLSGIISSMVIPRYQTSPPENVEQIQTNAASHKMGLVIHPAKTTIY